MKKKNRMFNLVTKTENPLGGECESKCDYCYIHGKKRLPYKGIKEKYSGEIRLYRDKLNKKYKITDLVFFCNCIDWLGDNVPDYMIYEIIKWIRKSPLANFLSLTKYPERYLEIQEIIPKNMWLGSTIETNLDIIKYSNAPSQTSRINAMKEVRKLFPNNKILISVEPILRFSNYFFFELFMIEPDIIYIGYDNYKNKLDEPRLDDTYELINRLNNMKFTGRKCEVYEKTLRKAWWE